jgi:hypothetical protein
MEESEKQLAKKGLQNRRVNCLLITQIATPTRLKKEIERAARTVLFLPVNAYVRNIRMTREMTDTSVNYDS